MTGRDARLLQIRDLLICIECRNLDVHSRLTSDWTCAFGHSVKQWDNGQLHFAEVDASGPEDPVNRIKSLLKKSARIYNFAIDIVSPVYPQMTFERRKMVRQVEANGLLAANFGSGSSQISDRVLNVDFFPYAQVDIVASIDNLPFADDSLDAIFNIAVLEHVPNPNAVIAEFYRVLKPGGWIYCFAPFVQGFHASPWDFQRFTRSGMRELFSNFQIETLSVIGPTSGMLWVVQEWIATVLSFGSRRLHLLWWALLMLATWPLKFLDILLQRYPTAENIASGFAVLAVKPSVAMSERPQSV